MSQNDLSKHVIRIIAAGLLPLLIGAASPAGAVPIFQAQGAFSFSIASTGAADFLTDAIPDVFETGDGQATAVPAPISGVGSDTVDASGSALAPGDFSSADASIIRTLQISNPGGTGVTVSLSVDFLLTASAVADAPATEVASALASLSVSSLLLGELLFEEAFDDTDPQFGPFVELNEQTGLGIYQATLAPGAQDELTFILAAGDGTTPTPLSRR